MTPEDLIHNTVIAPFDSTVTLFTALCRIKSRLTQLRTSGPNKKGGANGNYFDRNLLLFLPKKYCNVTARAQVKSRKILNTIGLTEDLPLKANGF